jgi:sugar/nucleoside kinase (ribokinase family)
MLDMGRIGGLVRSLSGKAALGADGFVDEVWSLVDGRDDGGEPIPMSGMRRFGEMVCARGTGGLTNEIVRKRRSYGGFVCNTGRVAVSLGVELGMLGAFGRAVIDPAFGEFKGKAQMLSFGDPAVSHILEFGDGKIMLPHLQELLGATWEGIVAKVGVDGIKSVFKGADVASIGYWSLTPDFENIMQGLFEHCFASDPPKRLFFDFADIRARPGKEIKEAFLGLSRLSPRIPMTLSLNEHEAQRLFSILGLRGGGAEATAEAAQRTCSLTGFDEVIAHTPEFAAAGSLSEGPAAARQDKCLRPVRTTGAGDSFNGGYIVSCLAGFSLEERLMAANATTRHFVGKGFPPDREGLIEEIGRIYTK